MTGFTNDDLVAYPRALVRELRRLRASNGWTRKDLADRLPDDISVQTLATYELGTRSISVLRLVELCDALGTTAQELLASTDHVLRPVPAGTIRVDLPALAGDQRPELAPARRWAASRLRECTGANSAMLDEPAMEQLAQLCGLPVITLIGTLPRR